MVESWLHTPKVPGSIPGSGNLIFFVISKEMHKSEYLIKFAFPFSSKLISLRLVRTCKLQVLTSQREMTWDMKKLFLWAKLDISGSLGKRMKHQERNYNMQYNSSSAFFIGYISPQSSTMKLVPYARHYNPRFVFFLPHFSLRFIFESGLYCREVSNYMILFSSKVATKK